ncbi:MAG: hypothetical protein ACFFCD_10150 [Promethearchaeota archaeon]
MVLIFIPSLRIAYAIIASVIAAAGNIISAFLIHHFLSNEYDARSYIGTIDVH